MSRSRFTRRSSIPQQDQATPEVGSREGAVYHTEVGSRGAANHTEVGSREP